VNSPAPTLVSGNVITNIQTSPTDWTAQRGSGSTLLDSITAYVICFNNPTTLTSSTIAGQESSVNDSPVQFSNSTDSSQESKIKSTDSSQESKISSQNTEQNKNVEKTSNNNDQIQTSNTQSNEQQMKALNQNVEQNNNVVEQKKSTSLPLFNFNHQ
ncbi:MAG TPA: hypothetical protein VLA74_11630, partial [Nitrososphaeraceae archaeon]|nr:hypothetical protein [Nitrososphaeraceae archaeon]